jgi:predicted nucleic acid-binding protein
MRFGGWWRSSDLSCQGFSHAIAAPAQAPLVLQELLQGFSGPKAKGAIMERFGALPLIQPDRLDHVAAAEVRSACRRNGVEVGTIDALLIQLCGRYELTLLSTDNDFANAALHVPFKLSGHG